MSGFDEIVAWTDQEIKLNQSRTVNEEFERISKRFIEDNRLPLADILLDDMPRYMKYLEDRMGREGEILDTEIEILQAQKELAEIELEELKSQNIGSLFFESIERTGVRVVNFFKRLFR